MVFASVAAGVFFCGLLVHTAVARCSDAAWAADYSPERCSVANGAAIMSCLARSGSQCGMRLSSLGHVGFGVHSMTIKAAPGPGVATTFYLSTNGGLYDKYRRNPWVEIDWEILGLQAGPQTRIWTNIFTGIAQEHNEWLLVPFDVSAAYHTYSFHVTTSSVAWVVDGVTYRTVDITHFPDVLAAARDKRFQIFASVWGRSVGEPEEGIPAFRAALGKLDANPNRFPITAGFVRSPGRRLRAVSGWANATEGGVGSGWRANATEVNV